MSLYLSVYLYTWSGSNSATAQQTSWRAQSAAAAAWCALAAR